MSTAATNLYGADTLGQLGFAARGRQKRPWPFTADRLANRLVQNRVLLPALANTILREVVTRGSSIFSLARSVGSVSGEALRDAAAVEFGLPVADLTRPVDPEALRNVPGDVARENLILPLYREGDRLVVAVADPTAAEPLRKINRAVGLMLDLRLATAADLAPLVAYHFNPRIAAILPDGRTMDIPVQDGDLTIGRADTNALVLPDAWTSSVHAVVRSQGGMHRLIDLASRNGVFVNGERLVGSRLLEHGDEVRIGLTQIRFSLPISDVANDDEATRVVPMAMMAQSAPAQVPQAAPTVAPDQPASEVAESESTEDVSETSSRIRAARIKFAGRVIAQIFTVLAALVISAVLFGSMPTSCTPGGDRSEGGVANPLQTTPLPN